MKTLLVIGLTFPEPSTTAAGTRMMQLLQLFKEEDYQIIFASTAAVSEKTANLEAAGIAVKNILLNDSSFDGFVKQLNPTVVLFDRYITEEQFGWRITENCPNALKILDTQDLHFLRKAREVAVKKGAPVSEANLYTDTAKRELASILRCDLSLIISEVEMEVLNSFKINPEILYYLPFLVEILSEKERAKTPEFEARNYFFTLGNFYHAPNADAVIYLKKEIWSLIRKQLPKAEVHIYGAYAPQKILELHKPKEGFFIKGWAESVEEIMNTSRVQLAPLRFGAGQKGKLLDAMRLGTPSVTTSIGAEGMVGKLPFGGLIADTPETFVRAVVKLYTDETAWQEAQQNGFNIIEKRFQKKLFSEEFKSRISTLLATLPKHRQQHFMGQILQHHTLQSTRYMSKWIEAKSNLTHEGSSKVCFADSKEVRADYAMFPNSEEE